VQSGYDDVGGRMGMFKREEKGKYERTQKLKEWGSGKGYGKF
jgi:hypothetical protein